MVKSRLNVLINAIKSCQEIITMCQEEMISLVKEKKEVPVVVARKRPGRPKKVKPAGHPWPGADEKEEE